MQWKIPYKIYQIVFLYIVQHILKISWRFVHAFRVMLLTNKQTNVQTDIDENITFAVWRK